MCVCVFLFSFFFVFEIFEPKSIGNQFMVEEISHNVDFGVSLQIFRLSVINL